MSLVILEFIFCFCNLYAFILIVFSNISKFVLCLLQFSSFFVLVHAAASHSGSCNTDVQKEKTMQLTRQFIWYISDCFMLRNEAISSFQLVTFVMELSGYNSGHKKPW